MVQSSKLEDIATIALPVGQVVGIASNVTDFPGSQYVGDFIWVGGYAYFSDHLAKKVENLGERTGSNIIKKIGEYFNEITIPLVTAYYALGETMIDWIPFNTMDENDVYAALIGGALGFLCARGMKRIRKSSKYSPD